MECFSFDKPMIEPLQLRSINSNNEQTAAVMSDRSTINNRYGNDFKYR